MKKLTITISGERGSGKSTLAVLLLKFLEFVRIEAEIVDDTKPQYLAIKADHWRESLKDLKVEIKTETMTQFRDPQCSCFVRGRCSAHGS